MNTISIVKGKAVLLKEILSLIYYGGIAIFVIIMCLTIAASFYLQKDSLLKKAVPTGHLPWLLAAQFPPNLSSQSNSFSVLSGVTTEFFLMPSVLFYFYHTFYSLLFPHFNLWSKAVT